MTRRRSVCVLTALALSLGAFLVALAVGHAPDARAGPCGGFPDFLANAITSLGDVDVYGNVTGDVECPGTLTLSPGDVIDGGVKCGNLYNRGTIYGDVHCEVLDNRGSIYGNVEYTTLLSLGTVTGTATVAPPPDFSDLDNTWPREEYLTDFYLEQVPDINYPYTLVSACGTIGPLYTGYANTGAARNLTVDTKTGACEVRLDGTIFVTGDFSVTPKTLVNLNGQTIFCLGDVYFAADSQVKGSGAIIAVGAVRLSPTAVVGNPDDGPMLAMSVAEWVEVGVAGVFRGSLLGADLVETQSGSVLDRALDPEDYWNYPPMLNTWVDSPTTVNLDGLEVTFGGVLTAGCTDYTVSQGNPYGTMPEGFRLHGQFVDITTTATYTPPVTVGLSYDPSTPNPQNLKLFHWEDGHWVDVTTWVDTTNHIVYGEVMSFSWFFIGGQWVWIDDGASGVPVFPSIYVGIGAALGAGIMAYFVRRRMTT